ncbi:MAG TPA: UPF0182 family protein, partial [Waterburya sp.]
MTKIFRLMSLLLGLWLMWDLLSHLVAETLWFQEVGYLPVFLRRVQTQIGVWSLVCSLSAGYGLSNLGLANRFKHSKPRKQSSVQRQSLGISNPDTEVVAARLRVGYETTPRTLRGGMQAAPSQTQHPTGQTPALSLRSLLVLVILLSILVGVMLLYYSKIALSLWHRNLSLPNVTPPLPLPFDWASLGQLLPLQIWQLVALLVIAIALIIKPQFWLSAITSALSLFFALVLSAQWGRILRYFYPTPFSTVDPLFGRDISFYIFSFPVGQLLDFWLGGLCLWALVAVTLIYLLSGDSLSEGKFPGFSQNQLRHLYGLGTAVAATIAFHVWLKRYELLYSPRGVAYGASYTDVTVQLPINTGLSLLAGAIALFLLLRTIFWSRHRPSNAQGALIALGVYLAAVEGGGVVLPEAVQRLSVQPNELVRERPYIQHSIALTRAAFDLEGIDVETFNPEGGLTRTNLAENDLTIRNIRLWDTRPLLQTNRQLQQIRLYYKFPDAQIDRYT